MIINYKNANIPYIASFVYYNDDVVDTYKRRTLEQLFSWLELCLTCRRF